MRRAEQKRAALNRPLIEQRRATVRRWSSSGSSNISTRMAGWVQSVLRRGLRRLPPSGPTRRFCHYTGRAQAQRGIMDPQVFLAGVVTVLIAAMGTWGAVKIAKIIAQSRARDPDTAAHLRAWDQEVGTLRQEMLEAQERLDFAERLLAQGPETRRVEPQR